MCQRFDTIFGQHARLRSTFHELVHRPQRSGFFFGNHVPEFLDGMARYTTGLANILNFERSFNKADLDQASVNRFQVDNLNTMFRQRVTP